MLRRVRGLWYSLAAIVATTALYVLAYRQQGRFPLPAGLVGHGIGIVGFVLMLVAAFAYTIRKRQTDAAWGSMESWLRVHMIAGLVGPYMVLLHTAMWFHGLAAVAMLLTVVVVISGVVGRYVYTAVPRVVEGNEPDALDRLITRYETSGMASADLGMASPVALAEVRLSDARIDRLATRRRKVAAWRPVHVSVTWALAVASMVHMVGALYYVYGR